jgi:hypothetical protein
MIDSPQVRSPMSNNKTSTYVPKAKVSKIAAFSLFPFPKQNQGILTNTSNTIVQIADDNLASTRT